MKTNFKTLLAVLLIGIMLTGFAASIPFTPQGDIELHSRYDILNATDITTTNITGTNNSVPTDWVMLKTYPAACPSGAITTLGDTVTCTDSWVDVTGDDMTGDLNFSYANITNATNVNATTFYQDSNAVIDASTISSQNVNGSGYWDALNSPSDINTADITDDNTYVTVAGDTMTGDLTFGDSYNATNVTVGLTVTNSPPTCGAPTLGFLYFDLSMLELCVCNVTNWVTVQDTSVICT